MRVQAALVLGVMLTIPARPAGAQLLGLPVVNSGVPVGVTVGIDYGMSNDDAGKGTAIGASAGLGIGFLGVSAGVSRFSPDTDGANPVNSVGGAASLRLFGGPLIPFRVMLQAGVGAWQYDAISIEGEAVGTFRATRFPVSLGLAATIPNPAFAVKPWLAPRIEVRRLTFDGEGDTSTDFAMSGGIELTMLSGLSLRGAYDRVFREGSRPGIFSIGLGYSP